MQVRPPCALRDPVPGTWPHGGLEDQAQDRRFHPDPWTRAQMGPLSMTRQGKPPQVTRQSGRAIRMHRAQPDVLGSQSDQITGLRGQSSSCIVP
ncbi:hypothetical protein NDU88_003079 [Pleurodeles waltl]|uniref:Uncharacterized protein n=1 Tax=Pleurodeles waltl TaxID=8319 RepID=A0AAV7WRS1_PLEWA|nr:hypothetical protein NDU88_003079 [Pleurodeles waltl]